jgi:uncharacterized repeat protein (TIGR01451 family)
MDVSDLSQTSLSTSHRVWWLALVVVLAVLVGVIVVMPVTAHIAAAPSPDDPLWHPPDQDLSPSYKVASQKMVSPGERLTYTIRLINAGTSQAVADVADVLPHPANYILDSASAGGIYDPARRALAWRGITVPVMGDVSLSFVVTMTAAPAPMPVVNTAVISAGNRLLERSAWVTLMPSPPAHGPDLYLSQKYASRHAVIPGETFTYTIQLVNVGTADALAQVTDPLPDEVSYVPGSATGGGVYDSATATLAWQNVTVPVHSHVWLTFMATAGNTTTPTQVINTAVISAGGVSLDRSAWVLLIPERPAPRPNLRPSHKMASQNVVAPGDLFTYTIHLRNVGTADAVVAVTDRVPEQVNYVADTASSGGVYDPLAGTVSWSGITVPMKSDVSLTFAVTASTTASPTIVVNTAVISTGTESLVRMARVRLVPSHPQIDPFPPVVHSLTIDDKDVLTSPTVTLHISATDNVGVQQMYLREWQWTRLPMPHWQVVKSSGWVPYQETYSWTLGSEAGTHFVGVWVADAARNTSRLNRRAVDFASLLVPGASIPRSGVTPYLVYYDAGVNVNATLTPITGDVDLYVWFTGHLTRPVTTASTVVSFTTPAAGVYLFVAHGRPGSTYDLVITPEGGLRPPLNTMEVQAGDVSPDVVIEGEQAASGVPDDLIALITESALNPPDLADAPETNIVYLPIVMR